MAKKLSDILKGPKGRRTDQKTAKNRAKEIIKLVKEVTGDRIPYLDEIFITDDGVNYKVLNEARNWVDGRFKGNIGIDQPSHGTGQKHAHVLGRNESRS